MLLAEPPRSLPPLSQITKVEGIQNSRSPFCLLYATVSLGCWMTWRECTVNGCGREKAGSKRGNQLSGREELGQSCPGGTSHLSSDCWKERTWSLELKNSASSLPTRCALVHHLYFLMCLNWGEVLQCPELSVTGLNKTSCEITQCDLIKDWLAERGQDAEKGRPGWKACQTLGLGWWGNEALCLGWHFGMVVCMMVKGEVLVTEWPWARPLTPMPLLPLLSSKEDNDSTFLVKLLRG